MMDDLLDFLVEGSEEAISSNTSGSSTVFSAPVGSTYEYNPNPFAPLQTTPPNYGATIRTLHQEDLPTPAGAQQDNFHQLNYPGMLSMYHPNSTPPHAQPPQATQATQQRSAASAHHGSSPLSAHGNGASRSVYQTQHRNSFSQPNAAVSIPASFQFSHAPAPAPTVAVAMPPVLIISDFSPAQDHQQGGGTKVLVCLENEIPEGFRQHTINVSTFYLYLDFVYVQQITFVSFLALLTT